MGNLKLGVKLVGGFLLCAAITLAVGLVGLMGISGLTKSLNTVTDVDLPAVRDLQAIKIAGESIRVAQRTLNVPTLSPKDRQRQYAIITHLRESYRKSWEEYESLPKTQEAERIWREFVPAWQEWVKANNETFEMAREWDKSAIDNPEILEKQFEEFRGDHYKLLADAQALALSGTPLAAGGDDATQCRFGKWLESDGRDMANPVFRKTLAELRPIHEKLHHAVGRLKDLAAKNAPREELAAVARNDLAPAVATTMTHFGTLSQEIARVSALCNKLRTDTMVTVRPKQIRCFELLDRLMADSLAAARQGKADADAEARRASVMSMSGIGVGVVLAVLLGIFISRMITGPVLLGVQAAEGLAEGDLNQRIDLEQKDEIGALAAALRHMIVKLREVVGQVQSGAENVASGS